jgi:signal peptidase I
MRGFVKFLLWTGGIVGAILAALYFTLFDVWTLPLDDPQFTVSVEPTLSAGDVVLVARRTSPTSGNLVRCTDPDQPLRFIVGRIVGGANDTVDLTNESLTVNGTHIPSPRACSPKVDWTLTNPANSTDDKLVCRQQEFAGITHDTLVSVEHPEPGKVVKVEPGSRVYLVSDNRHMHEDSRDYGAVDPANCRHIVFRLVGAEGFGDARRRFTWIW